MAPLHPQARTVLDAIAVANADAPARPDIAQMRRTQGVDAQFSGEPQPVHSVDDVHIPGPGGPLPVRVYQPDGAARHSAVLFVHGGGWALGSIALSDHVCRALCRASRLLVASVGYRLAPEHRFPAGLDDAYAAFDWLRARPDVDSVAVAGDSAGGNLAAAVSLRARDAGVRDIALQVLIYPALDPSLSEPSYTSLATRYGLTRDDMRLFWDTYLSSPLDASNPYAAPAAATNLAGLAPAFVITAEYDPLIDEGERYAGRLRDAGVSVELNRYEGMIHGFIGHLGAVDAAQTAIDAIARALNNASG